MPAIQVMALGAIDSAQVAREQGYDGAGGYPGYGGPDSRYDYGAPEPPWLINRLPMPPSTPGYPQNLLRPTDKTLSNNMSSAGSPVYALYGLGLGALAPEAGVAVPDSAITQFYVARSFGYSLLGAIAGGIHGARRNKGSTGWTIGWAALGFMFPLITTGVAVMQGYGKPAGK
jgi:hypothetical protein